MEFKEFILWFFYGSMGFAFVYAVNLLSKLYTSINELNVRMSVIIEKTIWYDKLFERHEFEINNLKNR